jgi:PAS domain S-box-containing protein
VGVRSKEAGLANRVALIVLTLLALVGESMAERLPIKTYTIADGLARDHINRIVQDSKGFLWFCTTEGLSRFDGYKFTNYGTEQGLAGRQVNDFLETRSGVYWVATEKGLCRFVPDPLSLANGDAPQPSPSHRFVVYYPGAEASARSINAICEDHAGTIWCGTSAGLFRLDQIGGEVVFSLIDVIQPAGVVETRRVLATVEDRSESLWVVAVSGLYKLRPDGVVERYTADDGLRGGLSRALLEDRDGRIWIGTDLGLYQLVADPKPHRRLVEHVYTVRDGLSNSGVGVLCRSSDGKLWAGTSLGISEFLPVESKEDGRFQSYTRANGLSNTEITALCVDRDGNLWIGTTTGGAMRLAANGFATYTETDGLAGPRVASIFESRAGELFVFSGNWFLNRFDHGRFTPIRLNFPKGISYGGWGWYQITFEDSAGEWWMTTGEGLVRYPRLTDVAEITRARPKAIYTTQDGLPTNLIFRLFEDSRGDIWISTLEDPRGVLTRWERTTETFHRYSPEDGIPQNAPTAFCEDGSGNLWIGFYDGGLLRYRGGRFTSFTNGEGVPPGFIRGLYLDHVGRLWVATGEGGLARVDHPNEERPGFITYSTANGLSSNQITCVTEDQWGMIYVGTGRGVDKLDPETGYVRHYTTADGIANSFINVGFRQRDGSLWFGTLEGLSRLIPQPERPAPPPPILITALRIAGVSYPMPELGAVNISTNELAANQNHIEIDFSGLRLAAGESLRYQYKIEGSDKDWSAPTDQRTVNYPNLPPGIYRFLVRAVDAEGVVSESAATVGFRILPPIWRRWWFLAIAGTLAAAAILALERFRATRVKALAESENRYRALAETASDAIFTVDDRGEITYVNPSAGRIFGRGVDEITGRDIAELIPGYLSSLQVAALSNNGPDPLDVSWDARELSGIHKSGPTIPLELTFGAFASGNRRFITVIARDVTDRKRAEEALRRSREERLAELETVRRRIATDLHDDIGSSLTQISILSEVLRRQQSSRGDLPESEPLSMIATSSRELVDAMSDIVWAINPQKDRLSDLTQRMRRFASDVFTARNITFNMHLPPVEREVKLGANLRREVFLIFKESINNMVRHSDCTRAEVEFRLDKDSLWLRLRDDGKGFDTGRPGDGHGLMSMRERARDIGGTLELVSIKGTGTTVTLKVPLDQAAQSRMQ